MQCITILLLLAAVASSFSQPNTKPIAPHDIDVSHLLHQNPLEKQVELVTRGVELVEHYGTGESCNKFAVHILVGSCKSLRSHSEQNSNVFAARLAVCELKTASAPVPKACDRFAPDINKLSKSSIGCRISGLGCQKKVDIAGVYTSLRSRDISSCLKALSETPQTWNSYSNARQHAMVICQAASYQLSKDETIEYFQDAIKNMRDMSENIWPFILARFAEHTGKIDLFHRKYEAQVEQSLQELKSELKEAERFQVNALEKITSYAKQELSDVLARASKGVLETAAIANEQLGHVQSSAKDLAVAHSIMEAQARQIMSSGVVQFEQLQGSKELMRAVSNDLVVLASLASSLDVAIVDLVQKVQNGTATQQEAATLLSTEMGALTGTVRLLRNDVDNSIERLQDISGGGSFTTVGIAALLVLVIHHHHGSAAALLAMLSVLGLYAFSTLTMADMFRLTIQLWSNETFRLGFAGGIFLLGVGLLVAMGRWVWGAVVGAGQQHMQVYLV